MNLLIDHGSAHNVGDTGMLEGAVGALLSKLPDASLHVTNRHGVRTEIWDWPRVKKVDLRLSRECPQSRRFLSLPWMWRYAEPLNSLHESVLFTALGRVLRPTPYCFPAGEPVGAETAAAAVACAAEFDGLHVVGGGNLTDQFPDELWRRCCLMQAFADRNKPVVLTGQQIGPFHRRASRGCLFRALRRVNFVGLREPTASVALCRQAALAPTQFAVMGDDSFGVEPCDPTVADERLRQRGITPGRFIAANLRVAPYAMAHGDHIRKIASLMQKLYSAVSLPILIVPIALNDCDSDIQWGRRLAALCPNTPLTVYDDHDPRPALIKGLLGRARGAVGVSYHFCTFALSQGVPAVCLHDGAYYSQKADGLKALWGDERLAIALGRMQVEDACRSILGTWNDQPLRRALTQRADSVVSAWSEQFESLVRQHFGSVRAPSLLTTN